MRAPFFYKKTAVVMAIVVIVLSTATLSYLSYRYTVGGENKVDTTLLQQNISLVEQTVDRIEQKVIDNDRILYDMTDVNDPSSWPEVNEAIKKADLNVDQVWFLKPDGTVLYPVRSLPQAFQHSLRELKLNQMRLDETNHLHRERGEGYFFASYVLRQNRKGEKILVFYQMNRDKLIAMIDKFLRDLSPKHYVSIVDFENYGVYQAPVNRSVKYFYERRFPSTFYKWLLQLVPRNYTEIERDVTNRRRVNFFFIVLSMSLTLLSLAIIYIAGLRERQLAQLKEDFISNVSHELKTPLSLIRMFSEILVLDKVKNESTKQEYYGIIHNESERMSRLVSNLLDFASLERGAQSKNFEQTNIARLVTKELEAYRYQVQKEGFQLLTRVDETVPDTLANPNALTLAFFNLLDNSVKYSGDQKQITVTVVQTNGFVDLSVKDCGLGIPRAEQERIFEKFYRGTDPLVQKIRGSGIGLSITKHVAEMHGGQVLVDSEPGFGSTFTLRIPIREAAEETRVTIDE